MGFNALCNTVMSAWGELESTKLENVYEHLKLVSELITEDNKGDQLTKAKRGNFYQEPSPEVEVLDKETTRHVADDNNLMPEDIDCRDQGLD
jgi:hypothetical protein